MRTIKSNELESTQAYHPYHEDCPICNPQEEHEEDEEETMDGCVDKTMNIIQDIKRRFNA